MPVRIEITGSFADEALLELRNLANAIQPATPVTVSGDEKTGDNAHPPAAEISSETSQPKKPGRPRGSGKRTPPVTEAGDPVSAPQEAVGNTSSVPAGHTPPAEGAQEEAAGAEALAEPKPGQPVASPVITQEDVRTKLKAVSEKLGMAATIKIIVDLGYDGAKSKVKDIREEHYAAVVAAADKVLAA